MGLAPLFILAILGAAAYAASSSSRSEPNQPDGYGPRDRVDPDQALCRQGSGEVSLLDSSALVRWVSCRTRTAEQVAHVAARLEEAAQQYPQGGYTESAASVRRTWNARLDAELAAAEAGARAGRGTAPAGTVPSSSARHYAAGTTSAERRELDRAPVDRRASILAEWNVALGVLASRSVTPQQIENAKGLAEQAAREGFPTLAAGLRRRAQQAEERTRGGTQPERAGGRDTPSAADAARAQLENELARAEAAYPGARREYDRAMREGSPSELRRAADQIESADTTYPVIVRNLRARAAQREAA